MSLSDTTNCYSDETSIASIVNESHSRFGSPGLGNGETWVGLLGSSILRRSTPSPTEEKFGAHAIPRHGPPSSCGSANNLIIDEDSPTRLSTNNNWDTAVCRRYRCHLTLDALN